MKIYGYVNDPNITVMLAEDDKGNVLKYDLDDSRIFIFYWNENEHKYQIKSLKGLNKEDKIIYEEKLN